MKPRTPPVCSIVAIREPTSSVKINTRVSPTSENTWMTASMPDATPDTGLNPASMVDPIQMPANNDRITCLVQIARTMARTGGSMEYQPGSVIRVPSCYSPLIGDSTA